MNLDQILKMNEEVDVMTQLGYPLYFLTVIGVWKLLSFAALLIPRFSILKECAYAGFYFIISGAVFSHLTCRDEAVEYFGLILLLVLTITSWNFRPEDRKINLRRILSTNNQNK